jgi:hypothetical protein
MPAAIVAVEEIQALSGPTLCASPILEQRTAFEDGLDPVFARGLALLRHAPVTGPEVELPERGFPASGLGYFIGAHGLRTTRQ